jgi:maltose O-acetyltransferase
VSRRADPPLPRPDDPRSQRARMIAGDLYDPGDPELAAARTEAQDFMAAYNATTLRDGQRRRALLAGALGGIGPRGAIRAPFHVDYGFNIHLGEGVFLNFGCVLLDVCAIRIGDRAALGPYVQILTADHPRDAAVRAMELEYGRPITSGADVWIGGGAILLPGVRVGDGAVIGAGAVVTWDVPEGARVAGNPARPL